MLTAYKIGQDGFFDGVIEVEPTDPLPRNCTFTAPPEGETVKWQLGQWVPGVRVAPSDDFADPIAKTEELRAERNKLLAESDWTQLPDVALTEQAKSAWAEYRQNLRDLFSEHKNPFFIVFPTKPE